MPTLVLLRHGQSEWNAKDLSTGWWDADLSPLGEEEAKAGGVELAKAGVLPDVAHTSLLTRAIRTSDLALHAAGRSWIPVKRSWRLNERHYGALQGKNKAATSAEFGAEQFHVWRRSFDVAPPPIAADSEFSVAGDPRYADLPPEVVPLTECLADVIDRMLPYWADGLVPDLRLGKVVLVAAHGNSVRALVKHLEGISDADIAGLDIPTGVPRVYELGDDLRPTGPAVELGDQAAIAARRAAVAAQGSAKAEPDADPEDEAG